jgi:hypothetical protein
MVSSSQIRQHLAMFLSGEIDLESFEDWFAQNTWNIHQSGSAAAEVATFAVEESLSEYSSRHINDEELRQELSQILEADIQTVQIIDDAPQRVFHFMGAAPAVLLSVRA